MHVGVCVRACVVYRDLRWIEEILTPFRDCKQSTHSKKEGKSRNSDHTFLPILLLFSLSFSLWVITFFPLAITFICLSRYVSIILSFYLSSKHTYVICFFRQITLNYLHVSVTGHLLNTLDSPFLYHDNTSTQSHVKQSGTCVFHNLSSKPSGPAYILVFAYMRL